MNKRVIRRAVFLALRYVEGTFWQDQGFTQLLVNLCLHRAGIVSATEVLKQCDCDCFYDYEIPDKIAEFFGIGAGTVGDVEEVLKELAKEEDK